jgi:hypothetical protein
MTADTLAGSIHGGAAVSQPVSEVSCIEAGDIRIPLRQSKTADFECS